MNSGIYKITNKINNKIYIGSSVNLKDRFRAHKKELKFNKHRNKYFQNSYNVHGLKNFVFEIIEFIEDKTKLLEREQFYLDLLQPFKNNGYNICKIAGSRLGTKMSEEAKKKLSMFNLGKKPSEKTLIKMRRRKNDQIKRAVIQLDKNYLIINQFESIVEASRKTEVRETGISKVCRGERNFSGGFRWKYKTK